MRALAAPSFVTLTFFAAVSCGEGPPDDCGDAPMAMIVFQGQSSGDEERRFCVDIHAASRLDATETSGGRDESYATSRPNAIPWTNLTFQEASEACGRAGKFLCDWDVLRAITPASPALGTVTWDMTSISALSPTSDVEHVDNRLEALNPYDMVINLKTGQPPFPESTGSVAFWTIVPPKDEGYHDPQDAYVSGALTDDEAVGGYARAAPVNASSYKHPLLGFRCCIDAKMRTAFEALGQDPKRVREEEDPDVPIAP